MVLLERRGHGGSLSRGDALVTERVQCCVQNRVPHLKESVKTEVRKSCEVITSQ